MYPCLVHVTETSAGTARCTLPQIIFRCGKKAAEFASAPIPGNAGSGVELATRCLSSIRFGSPLISANASLLGAGLARAAIRDALQTTPPRELAPFREIKGATHTAVSTPGDLLYHIRARTMDLIVAFERNLLMAFGDAVEAIDDVAGFRYFDGRDLLDFVDGTANPEGLSLPEATIVGEEDPEHAGGSYVVVQKYLHNLDAWRAQKTEAQEAIIGRTKHDNIELDDAPADAQKSHKTLCTIEDADGEHEILRDNMPFANPGRGEYGTYFIGYTRRLWVIEKMLERMFIGNPAPLHDRILDFSTATTGVTFFAPSRKVLADLGE
ncbi:MAG: Dyp-type peroxidase [Hyphomicrobium sp.]|nr:Dyp-type peroxidase [Hyphomicrobium sp.]